MSSMIERYINVAVSSVPERQRAEIGRDGSRSTSKS
jgi:hypothetical protein